MKTLILFFNKSYQSNILLNEFNKKIFHILGRKLLFFNIYSVLVHGKNIAFKMLNIFPMTLLLFLSSAYDFL